MFIIIYEAEMEYRDLYDENKKLTGRVIKKDDPVPSGFYYITVMVFIENSDGEILLQQRSQEKGGAWATTGGHPKAGESSLEGMQAEIKEELGVYVDLNELVLFKTIKTEDDFVDFYYLKKNIDLADIKIQVEEVQNVSWFTKEQIEDMIQSGEFFKWHIDGYRDFLKYKMTKQDYSQNQ